MKNKSIGIVVFALIAALAFQPAAVYNFTAANKTSLDSLGRIHSKHVSVRDHGAKGDGSTNDTTAVASAITAAGVGGTVHFDRTASTTNYNITTITLLDNQTLVIPRGVVVRSVVGMTTGQTMINVRDKSNVLITGGGTLDGRKSAHVGGTPNNGFKLTGIAFGGGSFNTVRDLTIKDFQIDGGNGGDAIYCSPGSGGVGDPELNLTLDDLICTGNTGNSIQITHISGLLIRHGKFSGSLLGDGMGINLEASNPSSEYIENVTIEDCEIFDNEGIGISAYSSNATDRYKNIKINRCHIHDNLKGISGNKWTVSGSITNCRITDNTENGIKLDICIGVVIQGNDIISNGEIGIYFKGGHFWRVRDNLIALNGKEGFAASVSDGGDADNTTQEGVVQGNQFWNNGTLASGTYSGIVVVPTNATEISRIIIADNHFGNSSRWGASTQKWGWDAHPYDGAINGLVSHHNKYTSHTTGQKYNLPSSGTNTIDD